MLTDYEVLRARFQDVVTEPAALTAVAGAPGERARTKVTTRLDDYARRFIAASPFVLVASSGTDGALDVSPKGDQAGFVEVLDDHTLAIPDRLGNNRFDGFRNLLANPGVGLLFLIPGVGYTLRVRGQAVIVRDQDLRVRFAVRGRLPLHVLVVGVSEVYAHCPKCMLRSGLWQPEAWPDTAKVPTLGETLKAHAQLTESVAEVESAVDTAVREGLY